MSESKATSAADGAIPTNVTGATILVVDDNEANRLLAEDTLETEGHRVLLARNGAEALELFAREAPDCVLLDAAMPAMDGFAVCTKIRASEKGADTPVVFLTAHRDVDTFDKAMEAGADDFLTKPVRPTELVVRVRSALELRRMKTELHAQYSVLRQQRDDLVRVGLQKERLTAFLVHDLKNPVNAMDLHAQLLLGEDLPPDALASVRTIRAEAQQLTRMILNLLDLSKGDEGKLAPVRKPTSLVDLVKAVSAELSLLAEDRRIVITPALDVDKVNVDGDLFRRLLANLVENALRHAPSDTAVTVGAKKDQASGRLVLTVADRGPGVPPERRATIFDAFVQLSESGARNVRSGRGLGLTFCKLVVEAHGGTIAIEDGAPGAIFRVEIADA